MQAYSDVSAGNTKIYWTSFHTRTTALKQAPLGASAAAQAAALGSMSASRESTAAEYGRVPWGYRGACSFYDQRYTAFDIRMLLTRPPQIDGRWW